MGVRSKFKNVRKIRVILLSIVFALLAILGVFILNNTLLFEKVKIELIGEKREIVLVNSDYIDKGLKIKYNNKEVDLNSLTHNVISNVDPTVIGNYKITYEITIDGKTYYVYRDVAVLDTESPVITTNQETFKKYTCGGDSTNSFEYSAIDNYDGIITDKVNKLELDDRIELSVTDSSGNRTIKSIPIEYADSASYTVVLNGKSFMYVPLGSSYTDPGAYVTDGCGNVVDNEIKTSGSVNVNKEGTYTITYEVNKGESTYGVSKRTVTVYKKVNGEQHESGVNKVVYLTFDDGPGQYTERLLDILDKYNVKATFFVTGQFRKYLPMIGEEAKRGHKVAVHTMTHNWSIYSSVENYMKDFNDINNIIEGYTGNKTKLFRFPGGSSNTVSKKYATGVVSAIASKMTEQGYVYFDWNVDSRDAEGKNSNEIYNNVINGISKRTYSVVLMHDIKKPTVDVIEKIIQYGLNNGYSFQVLDENSPTVHHTIRN